MENRKKNNYDWSGLVDVSEALLDLIKIKKPDFVPDETRITLAQIHVLRCVVEHHPSGVTQKDIAAQLHLTAGAVSKLIKRMVKDGIVEREIREDNRRYTYITLSALGVEMTCQRNAAINILLKDLFLAFSPAEQDSFYRTLEKLSDAIRVKSLKQREE